MKKLIIATVVIGGAVVIVRGIGKVISGAVTQGIKTAAEASATTLLSEGKEKK